jgi:hypothetical protein
MAYVRTSEHREKMSLLNRGRIVSQETRDKTSLTLKGRPGRKHSDETKAKLSAKAKLRRHSVETRVKIGVSARGRKMPPRVSGWKTHLAEVNKGSKNPRWLGGTSFGPYTSEFCKDLKREIRNRDNHECQLCGVPQEKNHRALSIHHIDYDKLNCDSVNLVSLCRQCHTRTNSNREYWKVFFQTKMLRRAQVLLAN